MLSKGTYRLIKQRQIAKKILTYRQEVEKNFLNDKKENRLSYENFMKLYKWKNVSGKNIHH